MSSLLKWIHVRIWRDERRRARLLLRFAAVEADGGHDLVRAAEITADPLLRTLFLRHAADEQRHADLFRRRGLEILRGLQGRDAPAPPGWIAPGERGLDDVRVEREAEASLLAFLHLSESDAARDFTGYAAALGRDPKTRSVFEAIVRDEAFHMHYTREQLVRVANGRHRRLLWSARARRLWKAYLRLAGALGAAVGAIVLTLQYYVLLPPFALLARRAARREPSGWSSVGADRVGRLNRQF